MRAPMMKNGRTEFHKCGTFAGCSCHNSRQTRRHQTHSLRQREARQWKKDQS